MPDQNSAASEHAIMQEITQPLEDLPHDPVAAVASVDFPLVLRGYDRESVDDYVRRTTRLVAELSASRSPEGAVRRALERVGDQVTSILARAHETAEDITSQSRIEAEERLMQARAESEELERDAHALADRLERESEQTARDRVRAAEIRTQELDAEVDRIWVERDRIVSDIRKLSEDLSELAGVAANRFPAAATTDEAAVLPSPDKDPSAEAERGVPPFSESESPAQSKQPTGEESKPAADGGPDLAAGALAALGADPEPLAGAETEVPPELEAQLREIPADMGDDQLAAVEGEAPLADPTEQPTTVFALPQARVIDLRHLGIERVIGCWQIDDILIDPGPASCLEVLLAAVEEQPRALLLTHIHLDHAGAAGSLVKRWPDLEVYVHEQGASHLADPTRLLESAQGVYGDDMERLWGEFLPVPESNLRVLTGGERLFDGRFEVAYTPGHASHHVSYLHGRTAFVGDVGGVRIAPETLTIPPTPPPDVDIEAWHASIDQLLRWKPQQLAVTHFGSNDDIGAQLADLADKLDTWAALAHTEDLETFVGIVEGEIERGASPAHHGAYKQAAPPEQIYAGLDRYWHKREGGGDDSEAVAGDDEFLEGPGGSAGEPSTHAARSAHAGRWAPPSN